MLITLRLDENYPTFDEFLKKSRTVIYKTLIDGYRELSKNPESFINVVVIAKAENREFETTYHINKNYDDVIERLPNILIPYFENVEDYETCEEIRNIYEKIKGV